MMKTVLITGGSEGIGFELAKLFADDQYHIILAAKDMMKLQDARSKLMKEHELLQVDVFATDLSNLSEVKHLYEITKDKGIDVLINNAGLGFAGRSWEIDMEDEETMLMVNNAALMTLTKLFLKQMTQKHAGTILNVSSTGAFQPGPYIAGYYASKSFVYSYTRALSVEAKPYGVHISVLCPGPVNTAFYEKSGGHKPLGAMSAGKVAKYAYHRMFHQAVIVPGPGNRLVRFLPSTLRMYAVAHMKRMYLADSDTET